MGNSSFPSPRSTANQEDTNEDCDAYEETCCVDLHVAGLPELETVAGGLRPVANAVDRAVDDRLVDALVETSPECDRPCPRQVDNGVEDLLVGPVHRAGDGAGDGVDDAVEVELVEVVAALEQLVEPRQRAPCQVDPHPVELEDRPAERQATDGQHRGDYGEGEVERVLHVAE